MRKFPRMVGRFTDWADESEGWKYGTESLDAGRPYAIPHYY